MIRTGKYSVFEGPVCGKEKDDAPSISRYFLASEFNGFLVIRSLNESERLAVSVTASLSKVISPVLRGAWK